MYKFPKIILLTDKPAKFVLRRGDARFISQPEKKTVDSYQFKIYTLRKHAGMTFLMEADLIDYYSDLVKNTYKFKIMVQPNVNEEINNNTKQDAEIHEDDNHDPSLVAKIVSIN